MGGDAVSDVTHMVTYMCSPKRKVPKTTAGSTDSASLNAVSAYVLWGVESILVGCTVYSAKQRIISSREGR